MVIKTGEEDSYKSVHTSYTYAAQLFIVPFQEEYALRDESSSAAILSFNILALIFSKQLDSSPKRGKILIYSRQKWR